MHNNVIHTSYTLSFNYLNTC